MRVASGDLLDTYTDTDLASEMNAMSFRERQAMEEDIHGVADIIEETPEFVASKIEEMQEALTKLSSHQRLALDRAFFLRPALTDDQGLHLMCLRARRFRPDEAAALMAKYFRVQRDFFGDDLLIHRITWDDVSRASSAIPTSTSIST